VLILILCSKFAKNRLSARLRRDPLGELTAIPQTPSWIMREGRGKGRWKGRRGRKGTGRKGQERRRGGKGRRREGYPLRMKILATTLWHLIFDIDRIRVPIRRPFVWYCFKIKRDNDNYIDAHFFSVSLLYVYWK